MSPASQMLSIILRRIKKAKILNIYRIKGTLLAPYTNEPKCYANPQKLFNTD